MKYLINIFMIQIFILTFFSNGFTAKNINTPTVLIDSSEYEKLISEIEKTNEEIKKIQKNIELGEKINPVISKKEELPAETNHNALNAKLKIMIEEYEKKNAENKNLSILLENYLRQSKEYEKQLIETRKKIDEETKKREHFSDISQMLYDKNEKLQEQINKAETLIEELKKQKATEKIIIQKDAELIELNITLQNNNIKLKKELETIQTTHKELLKKQTDLFAELAAQKSDLSKILADNEKLKSSIYDYEQTILSLNKELSEKKSDSTIVYTQIIKEIDTTAIQKINELTTNLEKANTDNLTLSKMIEIYKNQIKEMSEQNLNLIDNISKLNEEIQNTKKMQPVAIPSSELAKYTAMLNESKNKIALLNEMILAKQEELMKLRDNSYNKSELTELQTQNKKLIKQIETIDEENETIKEQNTMMVEQLEAVQVSYKELINKQKELTAELKENKTKFNQQSEENSALKNDFEKAMESLTNYENLITVLKNDLLTQTEKNQQTLIASEEKIAALSNQLKNSESDKNICANKNEELMNSIEELNNKISNESITNEKKIAEITAENVVMQEKIKSLQNVIDRLTEDTTNENKILQKIQKENSDLLKILEEKEKAIKISELLNKNLKNELDITVEELQKLKEKQNK